jgi:serine/threonine-protein kinase
MNETDFLRLSSLPGRPQTPDQQFWHLWRSGKRPDVRAFLAARQGLPPLDIAAIVAIDQYERWRIGERIPAEDYLPLLGAGPSLEEAGCDIVYGEYLLREQLGEKPDIAEYKDRFPAYASALSRQAEVHKAFADAAPSSAPPQTVLGPMERFDGPLPDVPGYRIVEELGRGGMGVVYKAVQVSLDRIVALKVMRVREGPDSPTMERMRREAVMTARLSHPGIVAVFDAGQVGPYCFFAMEYVPGEDLHHLVTRNGALDGSACLEYLRQAAEALQHAHQHGLVHRDIKPSNFIIVPEAVGLGHLKLLDLGLARETGLSANNKPITQVGSFMGTPDFIAPEQANDPRAADGRSDLYSLGCTFYYAATGQTPYAGATPLAKLIQHSMGEVPLASQARPGLPDRLVSVLARLMARDPDRRFQSAAALLAALNAGEPARRPALWHRFQSGDWVKAVAFSPDGRWLAFGGVGKQVRLFELSSGRELWQKPQASAVLSLAFSPDGRWLAWGTEDGALTLADANVGEAVAQGAGHASHLNSLAFLLPTQVVTGSHDGTLRLWEVPTARQTHVWPAHTGPIWAVSAARGVIVSCGQDRAVRCWSVMGQDRGQANLSLPATCGALSPDGSRVAAGGGGELQLFNSSMAELARVSAHAGRMTALTWSPDGHSLLTSGRDQTVKGWSATGEALFSLEGHTGWALCVAWSTGAPLIASGGADRQVFVWRMG